MELSKLTRQLQYIRKMHELVDQVCQPPAGVMVGARKGTQVLDVAHAAQLHLHKSADNYGQGGFAQDYLCAEVISERVVCAR